MKLGAHRRALELLEQHPGWSDRRIARLLGVHHDTVGRWRARARLEPATKKADGPRRRIGARELLARELRDALGKTASQRARARDAPRTENLENPWETPG